MALSEEQIESVRLMFASSGWRDVVRPALINRSKMLITALRQAPGRRTGECKGLEDHELRARLDEDEWLLVAFQNEIMVFDHNKRLDELDAAHGEPVRKDPQDG
jgi:hypothetical protein